MCGYQSTGNTLAVGHGPPEARQVTGTVESSIVLADGRTELSVEVDYTADVSDMPGGERIAENVEVVNVRLVGTLNSGPYHADTEGELVRQCEGHANEQ
jgi:hypothetical protein